MHLALPHREAGAGPVTANYPRKCWYVLAMRDEVNNAPLARRVLGEDVVLWRGDWWCVVLFDVCCVGSLFVVRCAVLRCVAVWCGVWCKGAM